MIYLVVGLALFVLIHSLSILGLKPRLVSAVGATAYSLLHAAGSLVGLLLIVRGYGSARLAPVVLFHPAPILRFVVVGLMAPVFPLALASVIKGRIRTATKHPLLAATKLWAFAHVIANGTLAGTVLFLTMLAWAVIDRVSLKRRGNPVAAGVDLGRFGDVIAVVGGLGIYAAFLAGWHLRLIGVAPLG